MITNTAHGQLTSKIGQSLQLEGYDVFYDHGISSNNIGRIVSYFGDKNERGTQLSFLDIAVVKKNTKELLALIEIEETMDKPKTIIADIFAFMMGDHVVFKGKELKVGTGTTLIVIGYNKVRNKKHHEHIREKANNIKPALGTNNSKVGNIWIDTYSDEEKLSTVLTSLLKKTIAEQK